MVLNGQLQVLQVRESFVLYRVRTHMPQGVVSALAQMDVSSSQRGLLQSRSRSTTATAAAAVTAVAGR
eukprot:2117-Heterococcus_DN1.PRE.1